MEQTLLLNATYEPLKVVHWQKAVTLWCQGKVEVVSVYDREVRSVSVSFKLPSVIRLLRYIRIKRRFDYVPFSRANIYARDHHRCQYCGHAAPTSELTFDHVVKIQMFLTDIANLPQIRDIRDEFVNTEHPPASTTVQVAALFHPDVLFEVDVIAYAP